MAAAGINIRACRNPWHLHCIGVWNLTMSFTFYAMTWLQVVLVDDCRCPWQEGWLNKYGRMASNSVGFAWKSFNREWRGVDQTTLPQEFKVRQCSHASGFLLCFIRTAIGLISLIIKLFTTSSEICIITGAFIAISLLPIGVWSLVLIIHPTTLLCQAMWAALQLPYSYLLFFTCVQEEIAKRKLSGA